MRQASRAQAVNAIELEHWTQEYAEAMRRVYAEFSDDLDVICLCAEAVMNLTPWKLWDIEYGLPAKGAAPRKPSTSSSTDCRLVEQQGLNPHPGIAAFLHPRLRNVTDARKGPALRRPVAQPVPGQRPPGAHGEPHRQPLRHWQQAADANRRATRVDAEYVKLRGTDEFYMISVVHNHDFNIWASMFLGQYSEALRSADAICDLVRDKRRLSDKRYLASTLEGYYAGRAHVLVRFGCWQQICDEDMPDDPDSVPITTILLVYAKAIAHAALGDLETGGATSRNSTGAIAKYPNGTSWRITRAATFSRSPRR